MTARAMWKAVVHIGDQRVPVKMYSALENRDVHFRLLHTADHAPVKQAMVNPETDEIVPKEAIRRGYISPEGDLVMLDNEELESIKPEPSRNITLTHFVPPAEIDHRYYRRPYYLGPDGAMNKYTGLIGALAESGYEGFAQWVMRNKTYVGALRLHQGYPLLIALRHAEEVVSAETLKTPAPTDLDQRELSMSRQLINMLAADFEPEQYIDEYRKRVMDLIHTKASGGKLTPIESHRKAPAEDLSKALEASLQEEQRRARRH